MAVQIWTSVLDSNPSQSGANMLVGWTSAKDDNAKRTSGDGSGSLLK